jgi:tetratricopeptide (TPR) repeat protein
MGRYKEALNYLVESLAIARELKDRSRIAITLQPLGITYLALNEMAEARIHLEEALTLAQEGGDKREIAAALSSLTALHRTEKNFDAAAPLCERCLALARELGAPDTIAFALLNLAMVTTVRADVAHARRLLVEALGIVEETGSRLAGQSLLEAVAGVAAAAEAWAAAARFYGAAEKEAAQYGLQRDRADEAFLAEQMTKVPVALGAETFANAEAAGRALPYEQALAEARAWLENPAPG